MARGIRLPRAASAVVALVAVAALPACKKAPTSLLVLVQRQSGTPRSDGLQVRVLDPKGVILTTNVPKPGSPMIRTPGTLYVDVDPASQRVALVVMGVTPNDPRDGQPVSWGWTEWIPITAGEQKSVDLHLGTDFPDIDADGIPDLLDNCRTTFNPNQRSSDGMLGDWCKPGADGGSDGKDGVDAGDAGDAGDGGDAGDAADAGDAGDAGDATDAPDAPDGPVTDGKEGPEDAPDGPGAEIGPEALPPDGPACSMLSDGFESGGFAAWTSKTGTVTIFSVSPITGAFSAKTDSNVFPGGPAYLDGLFSRSSSRARATFRMRIDAATLSSSAITIVRLQSAGGETLASITIEKTAGYVLKVIAPNGAMPPAVLGGFTVGTAAKLTLEWRSATSAAAADGLVRLLVDDVEQGKNDVLVNAGKSAGRLQIGGVALPSSGSEALTLVLDDVDVSDCF